MSTEPNQSNNKTLWELIAFQKRRYLFAIAAMIIGTISLLSVPYVFKVTLDSLTSGQADLKTTLIPAALIIVGLNVLHGIFTYFRGKWTAEASESIVRSLRHELYQHLERLPCVYHDKSDTGDLVQRCSSDVETLRVFLATQVVEIARVALFFLVAMPIMFSQDFRMSLLSLSLVPVIVIVAILFFRKVRGLFQKVDEAEGKLTTVLQENLTGIRVVRAFGRGEFEMEKFLKRNGEFKELEFQLFKILSVYWSISDFLVFTQLGIVLIGGGYWVMQNQITLGTWILFWWLMRTIIWPIRHIGRVLADTGKATVAIDRIQEILKEKIESVEEVSDLPVEGEIVVKNLTYSYKEKQPVLTDLSLTIKKGETVAFLGPPGSGKSTLVNLLVRLYDYEQGSIQIGGQELKHLNRDSVRNAFGMVLQDPFLYSKTVRENVVVGRSSAVDHEVEESAHAADIHSNIVDFEHGYETAVGERGVTLSGGQCQRLAIARALLKEPEFLVLDDSLSAVDTKTEAHILRSLAKRRGMHTTILIAHRLSSTRLADRIFVFDHGKLIQNGSHDELLSVKGPYQKLWNIQSDLEEEIERDLSGAKKS
jgi:ATP-binding cassette, subfamily B, bacterial